MFLGTARTSVRELVSFDRLGKKEGGGEKTRTLFGHLNYKELLALFRLRNVCWDKWVLY